MRELESASQGGLIAAILVVDDDKSILDLLRIHLGNAGYDVRLAEDAIGAGHLILRDPPDLVLLDIDMPYMSGLELLEAMRSDPAQPKVPVILLTAHTDAQERARQLGVGFLSKPIFLDQLLHEVARYLPGDGRMPIG